MKLKDKLFFAAMALVIVGVCSWAMWYSLRNNNAVAFVGWLAALYFGLQYLVYSLCVDEMSNLASERDQILRRALSELEEYKKRERETNEELAKTAVTSND